MAWMGDDPLTGDVPHRDLIDEEDEAQAQELAPQYAAQPDVQWAPGASPMKDPTVVFLLGQAACLLLDAFFPGTQVIGSVTVPELVRVRSPMEEEYGAAHKPLHTCSLRASPGGAGPLLVTCPRELPAEQAAVWARAVLAALAPRAALVAATLPAMSYRGPADPADADLVFSLQAAAAASSGGANGGLPPPLPEATMLGGLPAALLARCELEGLPATLVAGVQVQQVPDAQFLYQLGLAVQAAVPGGAATGGSAAAVGLQSPRAQLVAALGAAADAVYRSSASSSIFT